MCTCKRAMKIAGAAAVVVVVGVSVAAAQGYGGPYDFGSTPTEAEIAAVDIDVMPDGRGLPPGSGSHAQGRQIYAQTCASCHGEDLQGVPETGGGPLIGGRGSLASGKPKKTVESYWPYSTILFDYTRRAMPFDKPGSLTDQQVYDVVAFILAEADLVEEDQMVDAQSLAAIEMPNREGFIPDPRPDVFNYD